MSKKILAMAAASVSLLALAACSDQAYDPRGVDRQETLLSVSAVGEADTRPDEARFEAGVQNWARSAKLASSETQEDIDAIVAALKALGIEEKDIQTRTINVQRLDYGDRKGQFLASNTVNVRVRAIDQASAAVAAVTEVGANIVSGPDLRLSDPEKAANSAYGAAFKNAEKRAQAYAEAAGMEISRVLTIRDAGGSQGNRYIPGAPPPPPPPPPVYAVRAQNVSAPMPEQAATILPGQTTSSVAVHVDFALVPK